MIDNVVSLIFIGIIVVIINFSSTLAIIILEMNLNSKWMYFLHGNISNFDVLTLTFCMYLTFTERETKLSDIKLCYALQQKYKNKFLGEDHGIIGKHNNDHGPNRNGIKENNDSDNDHIDDESESEETSDDSSNDIDPNEIQQSKRHIQITRIYNDNHSVTIKREKEYSQSISNVI